MSETRYCVEYDKSGRAKCKKCKEKLAKGEVRICSIVPESDSNPYEMKVCHHPGCFSLPRKYGTGANKITAAEFVDTVLEDASEQQDILPAKADELAEQIAAKATKAKTEDGGGGGGDGATNQMQLIKAALEARNAKQEDEPSPKKAKTDSATSKKEPNGADSREVDCYAQLLQQDKKERTNEKIKDCLKWNRQHVTGNKDALLHRWIDGRVHGRLLRCPLDGGRLKLGENGTVSCGGSFDESTMTRLDCAYKKDAADAPRGEWFTSQPTKEQEEEMDRQEEIAKGNGPSEGADDAEDYLKKAVKDLDWNLSGRAGLKAAAQGLAEILKNQPDDKTKLDVPDDEKELLKKVGAFVSANKDKNAEELVPHLIEYFGLKQAKEKKAAAKKEAVEKQVKCEANGALISAFQELMELYAKEKNNNAAGTYRKVVAALSDLDFEITVENAKGLGTGKTKVHNIGKATADKIMEFLQDGKIEKLEEKRLSLG